MKPMHAFSEEAPQSKHRTSVAHAQHPNNVSSGRRQAARKKKQKKTFQVAGARQRVIIK